jgi:glyoxylase-like metal-dependent hydrolase (beta-lactamase superfamily II)
VIATLGHTPGHRAFFFESRRFLLSAMSCVTGTRWPGRLGAQVIPTVFSTSTNQCFESLAALEGLQAELMLPGHGEPWREGAAAAAQNARQVGRS